ncbi:MAG TPA: hypothetical protein VGI71_21970 [Scandinavium sp.]|jgi:hypothetical protein
MTTYNTGNPLGSTAAKDLYDNAQNFDHLSGDRTNETWDDRFGVPRITWYGMEQRYNTALANLGLNPVGTFQGGAVVTAAGDIVQDETDDTWYRWDDLATIPKTVPAGSTPESAGGTGEGKWLAVDVSDVLRKELAENSGATLVGTSSGNTVQTELDKLSSQNSAFAYIDDYADLVVDGDWTDAINAASATGLPLVGSGPYTVNGIINTKGQPIIGEFTISTSRYSLGNVLAKTESPDSLSVRMLYLESAYDLSELLFIKNLGFNTINHYCYFANNGSIDSTGTAEQLLDNAKTAGLQVNLGTESPRATTSLSEFVNATKDHLATWGYSVYDEPASRSISVSAQDAKILTLRNLTTKQLSFVDLISSGNPFNQLFSANYDIAFVDSYSRVWTSGVALTNDLKKMRFDYGCIKAQTKLSRVIPVVSAFTDIGGYYASSESQVIAASSIFGTISEGSFGAFVWDGAGDPNINSRVRSSKNLQDMVSGLASQKVRNKLVTEAYLFGGAPGNTMWPIADVLSKIPLKDPSSSDGYVFSNAFPVRVKTGSSDTDRTTTIINSDYSGIGFKGAFGSMLTNIKCRKNIRGYLECFNIIGGTVGTFSLFSTNDSGYTITLRYNDALSGNKVLDFNTSAGINYDDTIVLRIENTGDSTVNYRKFIRGLLVCCDW